MPTFNSRGLRGSSLEECVNHTNETLRSEGLALIQKIPTPITPVDIDKESRQIRLAYFDKKSTVDYIGAVQGIPVCFDAKECNTDSFPLHNIHEHQMTFMEDFERQDGIAFFLIFFSKREMYYYMRFEEALSFWNRGRSGGRKSVPINELCKDFFFSSSNGYFLPYLDMINQDLDVRRQMEGAT